MKKIFTNYEIMNFIKQINNDVPLLNKRIPSKVLFNLHSNIKVFSQYNDIYTQTCNKIMDNYNIIDRNLPFEELVTENPQDQNNFSQEIIDLLNFKNELELKPITQEDIELCDNERYDPLTYQDLLILEYMME